MIKQYLFYLNLANDSNGRSISDYLMKNNGWWANTHNFIQWAFPNIRPSSFNDNAPLLTKQLRWFLQNPVSWEYHRLLLHRADQYFNFADFDFTMAYDHNALRISRILHFCLETGHTFPHLYGFSSLIEYRYKQWNRIPEYTYNYWKDLVEKIKNEKQIR